MRVYGEPKSRTTPRRIQLVPKVPRPGRTCLYHGERSSQHRIRRAEVLRNRALNCWPWAPSLTQML